jgi:hypothetical protein
VSSTNKTDRHDIAEILLKVVLNRDPVNSQHLRVWWEILAIAVQANINVLLILFSVVCLPFSLDQSRLGPRLGNRSQSSGYDNYGVL